MARTKKAPSTEPKPAPVPKLWRDIVAYQGEGELVPGEKSPICAKCNLDKTGCGKNPYLPASGAEHPVITVVFESISLKEDRAGEIACDGSRNGLVRQHLEKQALKCGFDMSTVRYVGLTRCVAATVAGKKQEFKSKGNWCRAHLVRELQQHPPRLIIPVGTVVLGRLSHKSNAQDWSGRMLTYRGWPDDWLTELKYDNGSPFTGPRPPAGHRTLIMPIQAPYIVWAQQNPHDIAKWHKHMLRALELAKSGADAPNYDRPWFHVETEPKAICAALDSIADGTEVSYDLETAGLHGFAEDAKIVFAMFRWVDREGQPQALGFPWLYEGSPIDRESARQIIPSWKRVLYRCRLVGHNVSFDLIYTYARLPDVDLVQLTNSLEADTRLMLYALRQTRESLGLELIAYDWCPDMAGYEEEFEMLKRRLPALLDPADGKGGHYANVPRELWPSVLKPYVMGDVEVAYQAKQNIHKRLRESKVYAIPLADPENLGSFRKFTPPNREFVYYKFMRPGQRVLTRVMARGLFVDERELSRQEEDFPVLIREAREKLRQLDPRIVAWCDEQKATTPDWELDLEDRGQLSSILFDIMDCPVKRLTESGQKQFGEEGFESLPREVQVKFAAIDKFTLNALTAENPKLKPLQDYRRLYKAYTSFVRPMRNLRVKGIDKKERTKDQYLQADGCVHASFNQCGTRSGRLSCSNPNLQQLPRDSVVKQLYTSRFGAEGCIYQFDLSQIELRLLAAACGDPLMVKAYREDIDLHSLTASRVFNVPYENFTKAYFAELEAAGRAADAKKLNAQRTIAKTTNFLTGYGGGAFGLQTTLSASGVFLDIEECERIVEALFDTYPKLKEHIGLYKQFILDNYCAVSITGRVRVFEEVDSEDYGIQSKALRSGFNHLIQSTASDIMLTCMSVIEYMMREANLRSMLVSTVHDSGVVDARRDELEIVHEICDGVINNIPTIMQQVMGESYDSSWLTVVPLAGDCSCGTNYGNAQSVTGSSGTVDWERLLSDAA